MSDVTDTELRREATTAHARRGGRCEICASPSIAGNCSGLDVALLLFCAYHLAEHARICPEIRDGKASIYRAPA